MRASTMKGILAALVVALLAGGSAVWFFIPLVPFRAVYHDGTGEHRLVERVIDESEGALLRPTLERYNERYRVRGGRVLVTAQLPADRELRWNYSRKAGLSE